MRAGGVKRLLLLGLCAVLALLFAGLGIWQVERLQWKRDLIVRVEARVNAEPVPLPSRADWPSLATRDGEYRRVRMTGTIDRSLGTLVDALTERGSGYWLIEPLRTKEGTVLVNRGFVPRSWRIGRSPTDEIGSATITGLVRLSEPGGRFLRPNQPNADRWYSRDVAAIARTRGLSEPAPFFIDAEADPRAPGPPFGGLTVVRFRNTHLVYAMTWFALAGLSLWGLMLVARTSAKRG